MVDIASYTAQISSVISVAGITLFYCIAITAVIVPVWYVMRFKHQAIFKKFTSNGQKMVSMDKFRTAYDKNGTPYWHFLRRWKLRLPPPKEEAIDPTTKGRMFVTIYETEDGRMGYGESTKKSQDVIEGGVIREKELVKTVTPRMTLFAKKSRILSKVVYAYSEDDMRPIPENQGLNTIDREQLISEIVKAEERKKNPFWKENFTVMAGAIFLIILLGILVFGWGELMAPVLEAQKTYTSTSVQLENIHKEIEQVRQGVQVINQQPEVPEG